MVKDSVLPKVWVRIKDIMLTVKITFTHLPFIYVTLMIQNKTKEETRMNRKVFLTVCSMWNIFTSEIFGMLRMFGNVQKEQFFRSFSTLWVVKINCSHHPAEAFKRLFRCGSPQKDPIVRISFIEFFVATFFEQLSHFFAEVIEIISVIGLWIFGSIAGIHHQFQCDPEVVKLLQDQALADGIVRGAHLGLAAV